MAKIMTINLSHFVFDLPLLLFLCTVSMDHSQHNKQVNMNITKQVISTLYTCVSNHTGVR